MVDRIELAPADGLSLDVLTSAFNLAFAGYYLPMTQTAASLAEMMRENDVRADVSRILLLDGAIEGVGLVGIRDDRAWIGGMGIGPCWRGQGYGSLLLDHLLEAMRAAGARSAQLEALTINTPALALYERAGFRDTRGLLVYQGALRQAGDNKALAPASPRVRYAAVASAVATAALAATRSCAPAWQREPRSLERLRSPWSGLGLWEGARLRAYVLFGKRQGGVIIYDALSGAAGFDNQRADLVALLLRVAAGQPEALVRAINTPEGDPLGAALDWLGCAVIARQREMTRAL